MHLEHGQGSGTARDELMVAHNFSGEHLTTALKCYVHSEAVRDCLAPSPAEYALEIGLPTPLDRRFCCCRRRHAPLDRTAG